MGEQFKEKDIKKEIIEDKKSKSTREVYIWLPSNGTEIGYAKLC